MPGKFSNAQRLKIIEIAEAHGNTAAADEFDCSCQALMKIIKQNDKLLAGLEEAKATDNKNNHKRRFSVLQADGSVQKEWKQVRAHENKYMYARYHGKQNRRPDIRYELLDKYFNDWLTYARDVQDVCVVPKMVLYSAIVRNELEGT